MADTEKKDMKEEAKAPSTVKDAFMDFCDTTTVHGFYFLTKFSNKWVQFFWSVVVFIGFVGLSIHLFNIVAAYLSYQTTEYSYERTNGYKYPDVTVCNFNGVSASNLQDIAEKNKAAEFFLDHNDMTVRNGTFNKILSTNDFFWALDEDAVKVGHQLPDFVIRCRFQGRVCNLTKDFVLFHFSRFFNCYVFSAGRSDALTTTQGIAAGLSLTLFLEPVDLNIVKRYDDRIIVDNIDGVRVAITPPNTLAAVGVLGYDILPGHSTSIGFDIVEYERLSDPYSTCAGVDSMALEGNFAYSFTECKNMCIHQRMIEECGCFPTRYVVRVNYTGTNVSSCGKEVFNNWNISQQLLDCQTKFLRNIETKIDFAGECNCHSPCEDTRYPIHISQSQFPSQSSIQSFWQRILEENPDKDKMKAYQYYQKLRAQNTSTEELKSWTYRHFLRLNVYANSVTVSVREQIPMITLVDLMSQIGGCLGLWLGISIVTVVEFFDLGFKLSWIFFWRLRHAGRQKGEKSVRA